MLRILVLHIEIRVVHLKMLPVQISSNAFEPPEIFFLGHGCEERTVELRSVDKFYAMLIERQTCRVKIKEHARIN